MNRRRRLLAAAAGPSVLHAALGAIPAALRTAALRAPPALRRAVPLAPAVPTASSAQSLSPAREPFAFALIGDLPYNALEVHVLEAVFASFEPDLDFALHVGDIKASWEPCSDALLDRRIALLESSPIPLVYVPGDNEWTDCGRARAGGYDPRERLAWLRRRAFGAGIAEARESGSGPARLRPTPGALEQDADRFADGLPENCRWNHQGVRFVTLNVPGSNNGLAADGLTRGDWRDRMRVVTRWLRDSYRLAEDESAAAVVVAVHANPDFGGRHGPWRVDGYAGFRSQLLEASNAFRGPTLFLHGDTHRHRVERITPKLLRVESYGSPFSDRWVRIDVDPDAREPFRISTRSAALGRTQPKARAPSHERAHPDTFTGRRRPPSTSAPQSWRA